MPEQTNTDFLPAVRAFLSLLIQAVPPFDMHMDEDFLGNLPNDVEIHDAFAEMIASDYRYTASIARWHAVQSQLFERMHLHAQNMKNGRPVDPVGATQAFDDMLQGMTLLFVLWEQARDLANAPEMSKDR